MRPRPSPRTSPPGRSGHAVSTAAERLGGLDLLLVNSGGLPLGGFEDLDERLGEGDRRDAAEHAPADPRSAAAPAGERAPGDPRDPVVLGARADPRSDHLEPAAAWPAGLVKSLSSEIALIRINAISPGRVSTDRITQMDVGNAEREGTSVEAHPAADSRQDPARALRRAGRGRRGRVPCCRRPRAT